MLAAATISLTLYDQLVDWYGEPGSLVYGTALNDGVAVARAYQTVADEAGRARLRFTLASEYQGPERPSGVLLPTDGVVIVAAGHATMTVMLPAVATDLDAAGDRIGGKGPPGSHVHVTLRDAGAGATRLDRDVAVGAAGRFVIDGGPGVDLRYSDVGEVVYTVAAGNRFRGRLVAPRVAVEIGQPVGCLRLRGSFFSVELRSPDGQIKETGCDRSRTEPVVGGDLAVLELGPGFLVPDVPPTTSLRVPTFAVAFDAPGQAIHGQGPANQRLEVEIGSAFRASDRRVVLTDANGRFTLSAPDDPVAAQAAG